MEIASNSYVNRDNVKMSYEMLILTHGGPLLADVAVRIATPSAARCRLRLALVVREVP